MNLKRFRLADLIRVLPVGSLAAVIVLGAALLGCGSSSLTSGTSNIRVLNAYIPAAGTDGAMTVSVNGAALAGVTNVPFGQISNSGGYVGVPSGKFSAMAQPAGSSSTFTFLHDPTLLNGSYYTLVAAGESGEAGAFVPRLITIPHNSTSQFPIPKDDAAVRLVNLSANPHAVGLYTTTSGTPAALNAGVSSIPYGYDSVTNNYVTLPATQLVNLALVDVTAPGTPLTLGSSSNLTTTAFTAGQAYTLYVIGQPGSSTQPFNAIWVLDNPSP